MAMMSTTFLNIFALFGAQCAFLSGGLMNKYSSCMHGSGSFLPFVVYHG